MVQNENKNTITDGGSTTKLYKWMDTELMSQCSGSFEPLTTGMTFDQYQDQNKEEEKINKYYA